MTWLFVLLFVAVVDVGYCDVAVVVVVDVGVCIDVVDVDVVVII